MSILVGVLDREIGRVQDTRGCQKGARVVVWSPQGLGKIFAITFGDLMTSFSFASAMT